MKLVPTLLVVAAFGVLIWISSNRPGTPGEGGAADEATAHGGATELVKALPTQPAAPVRRDPDSVIVTVHDRTGNPQPQIEVTLVDRAGKAWKSLRSDAAGRATFAQVPAGAWVVRARDPDYLYTASNEAQIELAKGGVEEATLRLDRGSCGIRGRLVDGTGDAVTQRAVSLTAGGALFSVTTDARGEFLVNGLAAGEWKLSVAGFAEHDRKVHLAEGAVAQVELALPRATSLEVELSGSHLHPAHFVGGESALLRQVGVDAPEELRQSMELLTDGSHEHANVARARFEGLAPGSWELDVIDASGRSLVALGPAWARPVPVELAEGASRVVPLKTIESARGAGVVVPGWAIVVMCVVIGGLVFVTPILFPPPLVARRPLGSQR